MIDTAVLVTGPRCDLFARPEIDEFLHYRSVDVSTVKELCRRWHPEVFAAAPPKGETHRALDDIRESIAELRYYRESVFRKVSG